MLDIKKWLHSGDNHIWESSIDEYNRYLKPPKGEDRARWYLALLKLKYEFRNLETKED